MYFKSFTTAALSAVVENKENLQREKSAVRFSGWSYFLALLLVSLAEVAVVSFQEAFEVQFIVAESTEGLISVSDRLSNSYETVARSKMQIQVWFQLFHP